MLLRFLLACLLAHRLTVLVSRDSISERPREWFFNRYPPSPKRALVLSIWRKVDRGVVMVARPQSEIPPVSWWGQLLECPWCCGFWVSCGVWAVVWSLAPLPLPFAWPFAMSSVVGVLAEVQK